MVEPKYVKEAKNKYKKEDKKVESSKKKIKELQKKLNDNIHKMPYKQWVKIGDELHKQRKILKKSLDASAKIGEVIRKYNRELKEKNIKKLNVQFKKKRKK
jgi:hypothetical protein